MNYFKNQTKPPGSRMAAPIISSVDKLKKYDGYARIQNIEHNRGKRAKSVIDKARTSQDYYKSKVVHTPTLNHYEDMEWWERDTTNDYLKYIN